LEINMVKFNAKQFANKLIAAHLEKMDIGDPQKLRTAHKISQGDATLVFAYLTMAKAELGERFTRVKVSKKKALEAGKETEDNK
jgi:hypothetical protein